MRLLVCDVQIIISRRRRLHDAIPILAVITIGAVITAVTVIAVVLVVAVTVAMVRAPGAVASVTTVTAGVAVPIVVPIAVAAVVLAGRVIATAASGGGAATARAGAAGSALAVATRVEAPRCRGRGTSPLDLQDVIATNTLVMHVVVRLVGVAAVLILYKCKQTAAGRAGSRNVTTDEAAVAIIPVSFFVRI